MFNLEKFSFKLPHVDLRAQKGVQRKPQARLKKVIIFSNVTPDGHALAQKMPRYSVIKSYSWFIAILGHYNVINFKKTTTKYFQKTCVFWVTISPKK